MTIAARTQITADGERWLINGQTTYQGRQYRGWDVEGLLMNSRMTNAMFDDENPVTRQLWAYPDTGEWDADRNTDEFIAQLPTYRAHGLLAVTVNLQGGIPTGYYRETSFRKNYGRSTHGCQRRHGVGRPAKPGFAALAQFGFCVRRFARTCIYETGRAHRSGV